MGYTQQACLEPAWDPRAGTPLVSLDPDLEQLETCETDAGHQAGGNPVAFAEASLRQETWGLVPHLNLWVCPGVGNWVAVEVACSVDLVDVEVYIQKNPWLRMS